MSNVVEREITHINSLHSAGQDRQRVVTSRLQSNNEGLSVKMMLRSKVQLHTVNYATGVIRDIPSDLASRVMAKDHRARR